MSSHDDLVSFAERAAHDLNNPVTAISMALEMALDEVPADAGELSDLLARVQRSLARLTAMIDTLPSRAEDWPLSSE